MADFQVDLGCCGGVAGWNLGPSCARAVVRWQERPSAWPSSSWRRP